MADAEFELNRILGLARSQRPDPDGWSLTVDLGWLKGSFFGSDVARLLQMSPDGKVGGVASVRHGHDANGATAVTVTSMLRPGGEELWSEQLAWIVDRIAGEAAPVTVVSENLNDEEVRRWAGAGYDLVFEELAMADVLADDAPRARWPAGTTILEWDDATAVASFAVYEAAFRSRPGFPGSSQRQWIDGFSEEPTFLPAASLCVVRDGKPVGFVISGTAWIGQIGVDPSHRRTGLATALVTEARARMHALGIGVVYLHVNLNNPAGLATWHHLGWRECGRRGRFERAVTSDVADTI